MRVDPQPGLDVVERLRRDAVVRALTSHEIDGHAAPPLDQQATEWSVLLANSGIKPADTLDAALAPVVTLIVDGVLSRVRFRLLEPDWVLIEGLSDKMRDEQKPVSDVLDETRNEYHWPLLRHVLNAGWVARLAEPALDRADPGPPRIPPRVSSIVHDLCLLILEGPPAEPTEDVSGTTRSTLQVAPGDLATGTTHLKKGLQ
jgi:hypothetical protein